jgi:PDZ domain
MSQDPMPLEPELLELENELRTLVPLEMDFTTAQRLTRAIEGELRAEPAPHGWRVLGRPQSRPAVVSRLPGRRWWPWAAAAAVAIGGFMWTKGPDRPSTAGLAGTAPNHTAARGTVEQVFPKAALNFGPYGTEIGAMVTDSHAVQPTRRAPLPEATSPYGFLNVTVVELPEKYCREVGIESGVWVIAMGADGPAARQGIDVNDFILRVDGQRVTTGTGFVEAIRKASPGTEVTLTILRGQMIGDIRVRVGSAPSA